jgi:predicted metal-dependent phosphoesterase TrpH
MLYRVRRPAEQSNHRTAQRFSREELMWLKTDLHVHTCEGPDRFVPWTPQELIDRAAGAGYQVLSFTDHERVTYNASLARYAHDRGIVLIPGVEATVEGRHVLLYNFSYPPNALRTFADIRRHKGTHSLVVAPHPFFPGGTSLRDRLIEHLDLFDALEYSHFYTSWINPNRRAERLARKHSLPLLGSSDAHLPRQFGTTYSLVESDPTPEAVLAGIRCGRVQVVSRPLPTAVMLAIGLELAGGTLFGAVAESLGWLREILHQSLPAALPSGQASREPDGGARFTRVVQKRQGRRSSPPTPLT